MSLCRTSVPNKVNQKSPLSQDEVGRQDINHLVEGRAPSRRTSGKVYQA